MEEINIQDKILELIKKSLEAKEGNDFYFDFAVVNQKEVIKLKKLTGYNFNGYRHSLDRTGIIHALKHANIDESDILLIPYIIKNPDSITLGNRPNTIIYTKLIGNKYFYVEEIRKGREKLSIKTLYKVGKQKKHPE